ncbi:MAG: hypothetical protein K5839_06280, partial [Treponemataceae bacterium]|nr:hypothetical protein [Treponemataceae bacterium]
GEHGFYLDREYFESFHPALRIRLVYKVLEMISASNRVSYDNIKKFVQGNKVLTCGIEMSFKDSKVFVNRKKNSSTESLLFGIIEKTGIFSVDEYEIEVIDFDSVPDFQKNKFSAITLPFSFKIVEGKIKTEEYNKNNKKVFYNFRKMR